MSKKPIVGALSKAQATALTERIRNHIDAAWADITRAFEGQAWKPLGYRSWEAYVRAEFDMSRRQSYRLIDQARVIREVELVAGPFVTHGSQISERAARDIKDDLPAVTEEIRERVEAGEDPKSAVADTVENKRAEKARAREKRAVEQDKNDALRDQHREALSPAVKQHEQAKADAIASRKRKTPTQAEFDALQAENEELREANAALEADLERAKVENKLYSEMKVQFEQGGFDQVVAGKDREIHALETRLYRESEDKASWMRQAKVWRKRAEEAGYSANAEIDIETGEILNG